jgi:hypothetical protein
VLESAATGALQPALSLSRYWFVSRKEISNGDSFV